MCLALRSVCGILDLHMGGHIAQDIPQSHGADWFSRGVGTQNNLHGACIRVGVLLEEVGLIYSRTDQLALISNGVL